MTTQTRLHQTVDEFLATGHLGPIIAGRSSPETVSRVLGPPDETSGQKNPQVWKYRHLGAVLQKLGPPDEATSHKHAEIVAQLQLTFYRRPEDSHPMLSSIGLLPAVTEPGFPGLIRSGNHGIGFEEFRAHLELLGLQYCSGTLTPSEEIDGEVVEPAQQTLDLASGVRATFLDDRLHNLFFTAKLKPEGKQLTLFVPEDVLAQARSAAAADDGASVASVCTRWLIEHARSLQIAESQ